MVSVYLKKEFCCWDMSSMARCGGQGAACVGHSCDAMHGGLLRP